MSKTPLTRKDWDRLMDFIGPDGNFKSKYFADIKQNKFTTGYLYEFCEFTYLRLDLSVKDKLMVINMVEEEIKLNIQKNCIYEELPFFVYNCWSNLILSQN